MNITRNLAIQILKYLHTHKDFYFPFLVMCREYTPEDDDFVEIEPKEWEIIAEDEAYQTFQLWENLAYTDNACTKRELMEILKKMWDDACLEINKKKKKFPKHACQYCGAERKLVETLIDDEFFWEENEGVYLSNGFQDNFEHTGNDRCAECERGWTGE